MNPALENILIVEDENVFAQVLQEILVQEGRGRFIAQIAGSLQTAMSCLRQQDFDLVLLDLTLPDAKGIDTYTALKNFAPDLPVIVLSGLSDEEVALQTVRAGAQDYLMKNQFDGRLLGRAIRYAIERKKGERKLRESEEFFRLISENVTDMIAVVDAGGKRIYNSPSYSKILGCGNRPAGSSAFDEIHPEDRDAIKGLFGEVIASGQGRRAEYRFVREDGDIRHVESQSNVICDESGVARKVVVVSRDVTQRINSERELREALIDLRQSHEQLKAAQQKLIQSEKLEAVSTFAAGVAHEVKNPLQTVILGIDYLTDYVVTNDDTARNLLKQMGDAVQRADAIVRGLLDFSSFKKNAVTDQSLSDLFDRALRAVESELTSQRVRLEVYHAADTPLLRLDGRSMKHVLINLLLTEIKRVQAGGEMSVKTYVRGLTTVEQKKFKSPGLDSESRRIVVAEIITRQPAGVSGVKDAKADEFGLMVSRKIIELYGGKVECRKGDEGSVLTISFNT